MATYQATNACTWRTDGARWIPNITTAIRQGTYDGNDSVGVMVFDLTSIRNTYATSYPTTARLYLTRTGSGAYGSDRTMTLYAGNQTGIPAVSSSSAVAAARPVKVTSGYSYTVSAGQGAKTITISTALIDSLGNGNSNCLFIDCGTSTTNYMSFTGRDDLSKVILEIDWASRTTACGAPTACSVSATLAEGSVTLSWSGATSGTNNAISSYEIQYSESSNNSSWGSWTALTTVSTTSTSGSVSVSPPSTRGYYRRFQVRTRGAAGSSYYSGSAIKQYNIEHCTSSNGTTWSSWSALTTVTSSSTSGSKVVTPSTVAGTYTKYRISVTDTLSAVSAAYKESNSIFAAITACGAPTTCSVSSTLAEGNVTFSWSGASSGAGNPISSYEIQYSESTDGSTWGSWTALTTVNTTATSGNLSVSPSATRGNYRRFQVRTRGTAGANYYSGWKVSTTHVRKNTLPTAPTSFLATPAIYEINIITLAWSGAAAGTSAIQQYVIQRSTSSDGSNWSAYETLATLPSSTTSGSYETAASTVAGTYTRYRISVTDVLGAVSAYVVSGTVKKNSPPTAPIVVAPKAGSATYNVNPRFLITTGTEPDGQTQKVLVKIGADAWQDSVDNPECFSQSGYLGNGVKTIFRSVTDLPIGNVTTVFKCVDEGVASSSPEVSYTFTLLDSPFESITGNETKVKAEHLRAIREAVNNVRRYYGLPAISWSESIIGGKTAIKNWPYHMLEIRAALESVIDFINQFDTVSAFDVPEVDWLPLGTGRPRAAVMQQIQDLLLTL